ncbi:hypothetical protein HDU99_009571, partial [Rhizoclosmatium hyalinum]
MAYFRKDEKEESALPATASWAKPVGTRAAASPIPHALAPLRSTPQPSDSDFSDSDLPRTVQSQNTTNLMDLIVEKKKKVKKSAVATPTVTASEVAAPPLLQQQSSSVMNGPPGLVPTKSQTEVGPSVSPNVNLTSAKPAASNVSSATSSVPDEDRVLGSKALNADGTDELVPNLIRRGPPNSAFAVARAAASSRKDAAKKGGVSLYNLGYILNPTYNGLFDPFSSDPMALIRGGGFASDEFGAAAAANRFNRIIGEDEEKVIEKPRNMYQGNALPQPGVPDVESRWLDSGA